ncbi:MAG: hypothetical protein PHW40_06090 [Candidatus Izemoplasmatales bacterium]|nr:hypothetical protein [Candidatus Izemoplasmatales bacterium]MDD5293863.1 hypothetical protein [Candidatus Izemoplasmatales bacterium]
MKKVNRAKKHKEKFVDTGETVANMNVKGFSWYQSEKALAKKKELQDLGLTRKERRAMVWGALLAYLPMFLVILIGFGLVIFLFYLWVNNR